MGLIVILVREPNWIEQRIYFELAFHDFVVGRERVRIRIGSKCNAPRARRRRATHRQRANRSKPGSDTAPSRRSHRVTIPPECRPGRNVRRAVALAARVAIECLVKRRKVNFLQLRRQRRLLPTKRPEWLSEEARNSTRAATRIRTWHERPTLHRSDCAQTLRRTHVRTLVWVSALHDYEASFADRPICGARLVLLGNVRSRRAELCGGRKRLVFHRCGATSRAEVAYAGTQTLAITHHGKVTRMRAKVAYKRSDGTASPDATGDYVGGRGPVGGRWWRPRDRDPDYV